jgi:hypothetical protein
VGSQINALSFACSFQEATSQNLVNVVHLKPSLLPQVEKVPEGEVAKGHKVANGFHDVPTVVLKSAKANEAKLGYANSSSENAETE